VRDHVALFLPVGSRLVFVFCGRSGPFDADSCRNADMLVRVFHPHVSNFVQTGGIDGQSTASPIASLTPREQEILHWVGEGKTNPEIALILGLSANTVRKHVENILGKLGAETRGAAARLVRR
jgi:DNA-binding CsgD family transcriptional regulator